MQVENASLILVDRSALDFTATIDRIVANFAVAYRRYFSIISTTSQLPRNIAQHRLNHEGAPTLISGVGGVSLP
jgi:hypothetical protein